MLTVTYSMVAIDVERDKARGILHRFQQYLQVAWKGLQDVDFAFIDTTFGKLKQLDTYVRARKIEIYLIPALHRASEDAHALLGELDAMKARCESALLAAAKHLVSIVEMQSIKFSEVCSAMELYCNSLFMRLEKEEKELLPLAQRLLSIDDWFAMAAQFLADDANAAGRRRHSPTASRRSERELVSNLN